MICLEPLGGQLRLPVSPSLVGLLSTHHMSLMCPIHTKVLIATALASLLPSSIADIICIAKGLGDNQPIYFEADDTLSALMLPEGILPPGVWVLLVVAIVASLLLRRSVFGRHVVALGSSRETARLCGIDLPKTELRVYVLGCACAGIAAVMQLSYLSMGDPTTGQGYELKAIAAAVIGGASLAGGEGAIFGTLLGALIMTVVDNGCTKVGLDNWVQEVVTGVIIVGAVALDRWRQSK